MVFNMKFPLSFWDIFFISEFNVSASYYACVFICVVFSLMNNQTKMFDEMGSLLASTAENSRHLLLAARGFTFKCSMTQANCLLVVKRRCRFYLPNSFRSTINGWDKSVVLYAIKPSRLCSPCTLGLSFQFFFYPFTLLPSNRESWYLLINHAKCEAPLG